MIIRSLAFHVRNAEFLTIAGILMVIKTEESVITGDNQNPLSCVMGLNPGGDHPHHR